MPSNFTCLGAVIHSYQTCVSHATQVVTSTLGWSYINTIGRAVHQDLHIDRSVLLFMAVCVLVAAVLYICCGQLTSNSSFSHELHETLEIILSLFTAHLSFVALLINSIWLCGQVLAAVCDMLTFKTGA